MKKSTYPFLNQFPTRLTLKFCFLLLIFGCACFPALAQTTAKSILFEQASETAEVEQGGTQSLGEYIATSDNNPVSATLKAVDDAGRIPVWLSVNGSSLNGITYTTGSEISFDFDATNLSIGTYYATVKATAAGYDSALLSIKLSVISGTSGNLANIKVNFQDSVTAAPSGWLRDYGQPFGPRASAGQGSGNVYGWIKRSDNTPLDLTKNTRKRTTPSDILLATLIHMQANDITTFSGTKVEGIWQAQVANGNYEVTVSVGDGTETNSKHSINVEGVGAISGFVPTSAAMFKTATVIVSVSDGYLTIDAIGGTNTKINWITIKPYTGRRPSIIAVNPENASINVSENTSISSSILKLPNGGVNNATITTDNVFLTERATGIRVSANVNGTGGGDAITLVPTAPLKLNTTYIFSVVGVKDLADSVFIPYSSSFTTDTRSAVSGISAQFDKIALPNAVGQHSSLTVGPDGKLYALTIDGIIKRFTINADGTLGTPQLLYSLQDEYGTRTQRLAIGLTFDPSSTATNLIAWVTHSTFVFLNGPDWDGKLTRLSGPNLETVQDVLINLPRSKKDHLTNSIAFGPDKALYFTQACNSAMGKADQTWGNRNEHLLNGSVLRLDVSKLGTLPLDVKTSEGGGTYNPYNPNAPLTIYASGVRNAYDLVWHSNGSLYAPTNGSAAGGNTPASANGTLRPDGTTYNGPSVPSLTNVQQTQKDFLFRIVKGGFYGHPNPLRGEYVLNGGNPTSGIDPAEVPSYPLGTLPDANWRGYAYDFQNNSSPDGAIEYKSNTFNGALKGKLLVVRYSQHDDIITLTPGGPANDIISATEGFAIDGFSGFNDPLELTEDTTKGNIYVSEYGGDGKIVLLRPRVQLVQQVGPKTLTPLADAFVRNGSYAANNYGSDTSLVVKGSVQSGYARATYLKFSLDSVKTFSRAILRVYGKNTESSVSVKLSAFALNNDTWTEKGITWNNAPAPATPSIGSLAVNDQSKYYEIDVTGFVKNQLAGDKVVSFVIKDSAAQNKNIAFNSKENPSSRPQLLIVPDSTTQSFSSSNTVTPVADAYIRNGSYATANYGADTALPVKGASSGYARASYLKFPLDNIKNVTSAKLRVYGSNMGNSTAAKISAYGVTNDSWTEKGITWNNAPAAVPTPLSSVSVTNQEKYYEFDVTAFVKKELAGDKIASLLIKDTANQNITVSFNSKENAKFAPQLVVIDSTGGATSARGTMAVAPARSHPARPSCDDPSEVAITTENNVLPLALGNDLEKPKVYPNPAHKKFNVQFGNKYVGDVTLQIVDAVGKTFELGKRKLKPGGTILDVDITNLSLRAGVYFLKITSDTKTELVKLVIQ